MSTFGTDTFTGTAGTALTAHTADDGAGYTLGSSYAGSAVLTPAGRVRAANAASALEGVYLHNVTPASADYEVEATLHFLGSATKTYSASQYCYAGIVARCSASGACYRLYWDPVERRFNLTRENAGGATPLRQVPDASGTYGVDGQASVLLTLRVEGDQISGYLDGVLMGGAAVTNTDYATAGKPGLYLGGGPTAFTANSDTSGWHLDDLVVRTIEAPADAVTIATDAASGTITQGGTLDVDVTIARTGAFTGDVAVVVTGLPSGVTASALTITSGSTTGTVTLTATGAATLGIAPLTFTASGSGVTDATDAFDLEVEEATGTVAVALFPAALTVARGSRVSLPVTITRASGFAGEVTVALDTPPTGVTQVGTTTIGAGDTSGRVVFDVSTSATLGANSVTVAPSGSGAAATDATLTLTVAAAEGSGEWQLREYPVRTNGTLIAGRPATRTSSDPADATVSGAGRVVRVTTDAVNARATVRSGARRVTAEIAVPDAP